MSSNESPRDQSHATLDTVAALLAPLARLAMAHGITVTLLEEALRRALVQTSRDALREQGLLEHRLVSRISASTGLTRREVTRISESLAQHMPDVKGSPAAEVFTRWATGAAWPRVLLRAGPAPSFEALARSVTQDVHPRTLLDELVRLRLAVVKDDGDAVERVKDTFVPSGDEQQMLRYLAANAGGHLTGAISNVLGEPGPRHFDQAVFADELSVASIPHVQAFVTDQWDRLLKEAVPMLEARIKHDSKAGLPQSRRIRIGLYTYEDEDPIATEAPKPVVSRKKKGDKP